MRRAEGELEVLRAGFSRVVHSAMNAVFPKKPGLSRGFLAWGGSSAVRFTAMLALAIRPLAAQVPVPPKVSRPDSAARRQVASPKSFRRPEPLRARAQLEQPRGPIRDDDDPRVRAAVDRARAYLLKRGGHSGTGELALMVQALAKIHEKFPNMGVADDPMYPKMVRRLAQKCRSTFQPSRSEGPDNYEAGCAVMALAAAGGEMFSAEIGTVARFILSKQFPNGSWSYANIPTGDNSMTQYAILGLWDASIYGDVSIPTKVWDQAANWLVTRQDPESGGFTYHPVDPGTRPRQPTSFHTMTVAALGSIYICRDHLPEGKLRNTYGVIIPVSDLGANGSLRVYKPRVTSAQLVRSLGRGTAWLNEYFTLDKPTGQLGGRGLFYYLYALERYATLAGVQEVVGVNWYSEGAELLVSKQLPNGSWNAGLGPEVDSSFGVLFLVRSTRQIVRRHLRRLGRGTLISGRGLPRDLSKLVQVRGQLKPAAIRGSTAKLLGLIESEDLAQAQAAAAGLSEQMYQRNWTAVGPEGDRLRRMAEAAIPEVRIVALRLLAQTADYRVVPRLIRGMVDEDPDVQLAALESLCKISRKFRGFGWYADPTDKKWQEEIEHWIKWYRTVRPEAELDDDVVVLEHGN